jgi:hypothetical protein
MKSSGCGHLIGRAAAAATLAALAGCASPAKISDAAYSEEVKARQLDARGDHHGAMVARDRAAKQRRKAAERATWYY